MRDADILMYHSISHSAGPTSIAPETFEMQMEVLARSQRPVVGLDDIVDGTAPRGAVAITFDDGFADFAGKAWPILNRLGFPSIVYLPTGRIGGVEDWVGANHPPRPLMDWETVEGLAGEGVAFGGHSVTHPDLSSLPAAERDAEIEDCRATLEARLGTRPRHFAAPYGRTDAATRAAIRARFDSHVGVWLDRVRSHDDLSDLPRIEMFYFGDPARWEAHLAGQGDIYLRRRQAMRHVRSRLVSLGILE